MPGEMTSVVQPTRLRQLRFNVMGKDASRDCWLLPTRGIATSDLFGGRKHPDAPGATDIVSTPGEVMVLHVATGYRRDERNRLVAINDWVQRPVPRFWLGRTQESVIWLFRHDLPDHICDELESVCCPGDQMFHISNR